eukprot:60219-Pleurochrysis_carterae.AAC.1
MEADEGVPIGAAEAEASFDHDSSGSKQESKAGIPQWSPIEVYACVKACLSASESGPLQPIPVLEDKSQK